RQQELTNLIESLYYDDHVDWLINRVEELELEVSDWRAEVQKWQQFYKESEESYSETKELLKSIVNQNKRYREALEEIARGGFPGASYKARKALEGEENDG